MRIQSLEFWIFRRLSLHQTHLKYFSTFTRDIYPIYLLPGTDPDIIPFISDFRVVSNIHDFGIPSLKSGGKKRRPELQGDSKSVYLPQEAAHINSGHRCYIQKSITKTALRFLSVFESTYPKLLLDIGCGTGLSAEAATKNGYQVVGIDINMSMLSLASTKRMSSCDYLSANCALPFPIRQRFFDAVISISFLQWLTTMDGNCKTLRTFFSSVNNCLKPGGCFIAQFYPKNPEDALKLVNFASGFFVGALLACHSCEQRGLKLFLVLLKQNKNYW